MLCPTTLFLAALLGASTALQKQVVVLTWDIPIDYSNGKVDDDEVQGSLDDEPADKQTLTGRLL
jgi:hypothetical protein